MPKKNKKRKTNKLAEKNLFFLLSRVRPQWGRIVVNDNIEHFFFYIIFGGGCGVGAKQSQQVSLKIDEGTRKKKLWLDFEDPSLLAKDSPSSCSSGSEQDDCPSKEKPSKSPSRFLRYLVNQTSSFDFHSVQFHFFFGKTSRSFANVEFTTLSSHTPRLIFI